ncbi:MAG: class I SAM-dependent methyltransferase [archaeon]
MNKDKELLEKTYEKPGAIWTSQKPPTEIVELIESGKIKPGKCLDVGCGEGFYSIYLASKGFDVTGIDLSEKAIEYAKRNAEEKGVKVKFIAMDVMDISKIKEKYDFIFEWTLLHFLMPEERKKYVENIYNLLNDNGKYLSICFNEQSSMFGTDKKIRVIPKNSRGFVGGKLYFSSVEELQDLFKPYFNIIENKVFEALESGGRGFLNYFFMEKKNEK